MKALRHLFKHTTLAVICTYLLYSSQSLARPNPQQIIFTDVPFFSALVECDGFGPVIIDVKMDTLYGFLLGPDGQGWIDSNEGWHLLQHAHGDLSAISTDFNYSWQGKFAGAASFNEPNPGESGVNNYVERIILKSNGTWPDLRLVYGFRVVVSANGEYRVFYSIDELYCI